MFYANSFELHCGTTRVIALRRDKSEVTLARHIYESNTASKQKACLKIFAHTINIERSTFYNNYITDLQFISPFDSITSLTAKTILMKENTFINNTSGLQGVLSFEECKEATISLVLCTFVLNSAQEAGAVNFGASSSFLFIDVRDCKFNENFAESIGGAIFFSPYSVYKSTLIQQTDFSTFLNSLSFIESYLLIVGNRALEKGGALLFANSRQRLRGQGIVSDDKPTEPVFFLIIGSFFKSNSAIDGSCICLILSEGLVVVKESKFTSPDPEKTLGSLVTRLVEQDADSSPDVIERTKNLSLTVLKCTFFDIGPFKNEPFQDFAVIKIYRAQVQIIATTFSNINFTFTVGVIVVFHSSGFLSEIDIVNSTSSAFYIHRNHDNCITSNYAVPTGLMIVGDSPFGPSSFWIRNSNFLNISSINSQGASITIANFSNGIGIIKSRFEFNRALEGAGLYAVESKYIFLFDCLFRENEVGLEENLGGALSFEVTSYIEIAFSTFIDNLAGFGGAVSFNRTDQSPFPNKGGRSVVHGCVFYSLKESARKNFFFVSNGEYFYHLCNTSTSINEKTNSLSARESYFFNITCNSKASPSIGLYLESTHQSSLNWTNGLLNFSFALKYKLDSGEARALFGSNNSLLISQDFSSKYKVIAIKSANSPSPKDPFADSFQEVTNDLNLITLALNKCARGEFFNGVSCIPCPSGTYSLDIISLECKQCPLGATCWGTYNLSTRLGFWRRNEYAEDIYECGENSENCLGGLKTTCKQGYSGPLCMACNVEGDSKFMLSSLRFCSRCADNPTNEGVMITFLVIIALYQSYYIFTMYTLNKIFSDPQRSSITLQTRLERRRSAMFIKVLTLYLQILSIVQSIDIGSSKVVKEAISAIGSPSNSIIFSYNCWIVQNSEDWKKYYIYLNFVFVNLIVVSKYLLIALTWGVLRYVFRRKIGKRVLIVAFLSLTYLEQPGMLSKLFSFLSCRTLDGVYYLRSDANFQCYTEEHWAFVKILVVPGILYWVFLYPGISLTLLLYYRKDLESRGTKIMLGSFYQDFKRKYFFWELVQMGFKLLLIILNDFIIDDIKTKGLTFIIVILSYLFLHDFLHPYSEEFNEFNNVISICNRFFIASIFFAVYSVKNQSTALEMISKIFFYAVNLVFFIMVIIGFIVVFKPKLKRLQSFLLRIYRRWRRIPEPQASVKAESIVDVEPQGYGKVTSRATEETNGESPTPKRENCDDYFEEEQKSNRV